MIFKIIISDKISKQSHIKNKFRSGRKEKKNKEEAKRKGSCVEKYKNKSEKKIRHLETTLQKKRQKSPHMQRNNTDNLEVYRAAQGKPM